MVTFPQQRTWDAATILQGVTPGVAPAAIWERAQDIILRDCLAEYDSGKLIQAISSLPINFTPEFREFQVAWQRDEHRHYLALRKTYSVLFGVSEEEVAAQVDDRPLDLAPITKFLRDEFTILVMVCYEEGGSMRTYRIDRDEMYCHFGETFQRIAASLARDEGIHFANAAEVLLRRHRNRFGEVPALLDAMMGIEGTYEYSNTFVFEHSGGYFTPQFNLATRNIVTSRLGIEG
jgi:hypothetical protein